MDVFMIVLVLVIVLVLPLLYLLTIFSRSSFFFGSSIRLLPLCCSLILSALGPIPLENLSVLLLPWPDGVRVPLRRHY